MNRRIPVLRMLIGFLLCASCASGSGPEFTDADDSGHADALTAPASDAAGTGAVALPSAWPAGKYISVDEVHARLQANAPDMLLVNVVDEEYYNLGFLAGSLKIPWDKLAARLDELDHARHIVIYCRKGVRSESAYTTLIDSAFSLVWVMEGGIERWITAGYPTIAD
jgi:rhodanese-related sulfurtransferase